MTRLNLSQILFASVCSLFVVSCAAEDASRIDSSAVAPDGDCHDPEDSCDGGDGGGDHGDDGGGGDGGGDGGNNGGGDCGCNECGCDVDLDLDLAADVQLDVSGTGVYVGLSSCGLLDVAGDFHLSLDASAMISGDDGDLHATITATNDASLEIDVGDGCTCEGLTAEVVASGSASLNLEANLASCDLACDLHADADAQASCDANDGDLSCEGNVYAAAHFSCMATCELAASISASASLDASVNVSLDADDADSYIGTVLDIDLDAMLDVEGNVLLSLD